MSVTPARPLSQTLEVLDLSLASCPSLWALLGVASAAAAQELILWQFDRLTEVPAQAPPFCSLTIEQWAESTPATGTRRATGVQATVYVVWPTLHADGDSGRDEALRALNAAGGLLVELADQMQQAGRVSPAARTLYPPQPCVLGVFSAPCWEMRLDLSWR